MKQNAIIILNSEAALQAKAIEYVEIKFTWSNGKQYKIKLCILLKHSFNNNRTNASLPSFPWVLLK